MALRILIVLLILAVPLELPGCMQVPEAVFHEKTFPAEGTFLEGQLGILHPSYARKHLVVAYRYMSGIRLNNAETEAISAWPPFGPDEEVWLAARNNIPGIAPIERIDVYRAVQKEGRYYNYINCNGDAFITAASTLERARSKLYAKDWIAAQDTVFADCSQGNAIPPLASDPQLRSDRAYQIASAKFYSEQYDEARKDFKSIAGDASSPWHVIAPYLAARCLIRAGNMADAERELQTIVANPAMAHWHASANGLLAFVRLRLYPEHRMHELALALVKPNSQATIQQDLTDYRRLFDQDVRPTENDDLTDWIVNFQAGGKGALEKWRDTHSLAWLVAALEYASANGSGPPDLMAAAAAVKPDSPADVTVNYDRVRLLPDNDARALAVRLLDSDIPVSARNQFRAECLRMARNLEEFLRYAGRTPVGDDGMPHDDTIDDDSAPVFDRALPLALLQQASSNPLLPAKTREQLARVVSIRELLLSATPDFAAVFHLLHTPGDEPIVLSGYGRLTTDLGELDPLKDNWWCAGSSGPPHWTPPDQRPPEAAASFLPAADRQQAAAEWGKLAAIPAAPDWLGAQALAFAEKNPRDPRVPEALYLVVRASRYGCTDEKTGDFSKRAFDLLHRRYPANEWTKKTPFWYK
jgi:hypothetical protein